MDVYIGRQPIFNGNEKIVAYELLYRSQHIGNSLIEDADGATIDVLVNSLLNIGFEQVANGKPCFVNFTENLLLTNITEYLNPNQIVIEILEDVSITPAIIHSVKELKVLGFKIALDDFILDEHIEAYNELFTVIDFLKVDFLLSPIEKCIEINEIVKSKYPNIKLLAEKVETREQLDIGRQAGYELFQGYFFEKPQVLTTVDIPSNSIHYFDIIAQLNHPEPDINKIVKLIEMDISLSYKIMQMINTTKVVGKRKIYSIKQAVARIGFNELRKWLYLLALRGKNSNHKQDAYVELIRSSLIRAKVCERLARMTQKVSYTESFLVGMFSLIDALLQRPLANILKQLPLSDEISDTLLGKETAYTPFLKLSIAIGRMDLSQAESLIKELDLKNITIEQLHKEAIEWAENAMMF